MRLMRLCAKQPLLVTGTCNPQPTRRVVGMAHSFKSGRAAVQKDHRRDPPFWLKQLRQSRSPVPHLAAHIHGLIVGGRDEHLPDTALRAPALVAVVHDERNPPASSTRTPRLECPAAPMQRLQAPQHALAFAQRARARARARTHPVSPETNSSECFILPGRAHEDAQTDTHEHT